MGRPKGLADTAGLPTRGGRGGPSAAGPARAPPPPPPPCASSTPRPEGEAAPAARRSEGAGRAPWRRGPLLETPTGELGANAGPRERRASQGDQSGHEPPAPPAPHPGPAGRPGWVCDSSGKPVPKPALWRPRGQQGGGGGWGQPQPEAAVDLRFRTLTSTWGGRESLRLGSEAVLGLKQITFHS